MEHKQMVIAGVILLLLISAGVVLVLWLTHKPVSTSDAAEQRPVPPMTEEELQQGWYYGNAQQRKPNTPMDWKWTKIDKPDFIPGGRSSGRWYDPKRKRIGPSPY